MVFFLKFHPEEKVFSMKDEEVLEFLDSLLLSPE
jgi:hypothetical protein